MRKNARRILCLLLLAVLTLGLATAQGCGAPKVTIRVFNWGDYIGETTNKDFTKATGIGVSYQTFATNEDMYAKLKTGGASFDVIIPSDYMISKMIEEDMLEKLDFANIPNFSMIDPAQRGREYDPKDEYSVAYMWGTVGILYNKTMVSDEVDSWNILWNEKYKGQIFMLDSMRDSMAIALLKLGYSVNTTDTAKLEAAGNALKAQKPLVLAYVGDEVKEKMKNDEAAFAVVWSGDAVTMIRDNPDLAYVIPKEGGNVWVDAMVIPKGSAHKAEAEAYINYMCSTEAAAANAEYIGYSTPQTEARAALPEDVRNDPVAYPPASVTSKLEVFVNLPDETIAIYDRIWTEITSE